MALGADQLVPIGPLGILGIILHFFSVEHRQHVGNAQSAAQVAGAQGVDGLQGRQTNPDRQGLEFFLLRLFHCIHLMFCVTRLPRGAEP